MKYSTSIGIDTHSKKNSVCALVDGSGELIETTLSQDPKQLISWIKKQNFPEPLRCCYEAGPTGFNLARALSEQNIECVVVAPSKLPKRSDRKKNDRVDAEWLSRMLAAGSVHQVYIPSKQEESLCHLSRLRAQTASDLKRAKQRVSSFLLMTATEYTLTKRKWTKTFKKWAQRYEFEEPTDTFVFQRKMRVVLNLEEELLIIEDQIESIVKSSKRLSTMTARLCAIHGIGRITAFSLICEVYDFNRFSKGSAFASFIGLVPSENSSGKKTSFGSIAKCGNANLRKLLIEVINIYSKPRKSCCLDNKQVPENIRHKAEKCVNRLYRRRKYLQDKGLNNNKIKVALARELCEWIYWIVIEPAA